MQQAWPSSFPTPEPRRQRSPEAQGLPSLGLRPKPPSQASIPSLHSKPPSQASISGARIPEPEAQGLPSLGPSWVSNPGGGILGAHLSPPSPSPPSPVQAKTEGSHQGTKDRPGAHRMARFSALCDGKQLKDKQIKNLHPAQNPRIFGVTPRAQDGLFPAERCAPHVLSIAASRRPYGLPRWRGRLWWRGHLWWGGRPARLRPEGSSMVRTQRAAHVSKRSAVSVDRPDRSLTVAARFALCPSSARPDCSLTVAARFARMTRLCEPMAGETPTPPRRCDPQLEGRTASRGVFGIS